MKRLLLPAALALACAACGPNMSAVRAYVAASPHRAVAGFPLDYHGAQVNAPQAAGAALAAKLRADGFRLVDARKTLAAYEGSELKKGAFGNVREAARLAKALGAQAALVGVIDDAFERLDKRPEVFRWEPVAPPACCYQPTPCPSTPVYDPSFNQWVPRCSGNHRKVLVSPPVNDRYAALSMRLRFIDAASEKVLWEGSYNAEIHHSSLPLTADAVTEILNEQLADAAMKQRF